MWNDEQISKKHGASWKFEFVIKVKEEWSSKVASMALIWRYITTIWSGDIVSMGYRSDTKMTFVVRSWWVCLCRGNEMLNIFWWEIFVQRRRNWWWMACWQNGGEERKFVPEGYRRGKLKWEWHSVLLSDETTRWCLKSILLWNYQKCGLGWLFTGRKVCKDYVGSYWLKESGEKRCPSGCIIY